MKHWNRLPFDIEEAVDQPWGKVHDAEIVDLNQFSSTIISVEEATTSNHQKDRQIYADNEVLLLEAKTRLYIACIVLGILILLIVCGFVIFLLRGDSSILSVVLGLVEGLVGGVIGYFFAKWEKRL